ncbi:MAG TPA: hypothetical protein VIS99_08445 [Terrimicrobiaceae bacterium]
MRESRNVKAVSPSGIFKKISSLSTALSVLLFGDRALATPGNESPGRQLGDDERALEPLVLKPARPKEMNEFQFAGHRSHSSHSSHRSHSSHYSGSRHPSHYSGSKISTPTPPPTPVYVPRVVSTPYPTPAPTPTPIPSPSPTPIRAQVNTPLISIEFKNGAIYYGRVVIKAPTGITFQTMDKKVHKIPKSVLSPKSVRELGLEVLTIQTPSKATPGVR